MRTAGFVLVGGQSQRMGRDKALLPWHAGVLVQDAAAKVATAAGNVTLIGRPERYAHLGLPCVTDLRPGFGPLAGIETALSLAHSLAQSDYGLVLACDMPEVDASHLEELLRTAQKMDSRCVVSRDLTGRVHPLCAVYRSDCLPVISKAIDEGRLRLLDITAELGAHVVSTAMLIPNINTVEQWEAAQRAHVL